MEANLKHFVLERVYLPTETLGSWYDGATLICKTLERPNRNNQRDNPNTEENESGCIPEGIYILEKQEPKEDRPYGYFRFRAIPGRSLNKYIKDKLGNYMSSILVHRISYVKDLLGCIGVGGRFADLNKDGVLDMADSSSKLEWMYRNLPDVFILEIKKKP